MKNVIKSYRKTINYFFIVMLLLILFFLKKIIVFTPFIIKTYFANKIINIFS